MLVQFLKNNYIKIKPSHSKLQNSFFFICPCSTIAIFKWKYYNKIKCKFKRQRGKEKEWHMKNTGRWKGFGENWTLGNMTNCSEGPSCNGTVRFLIWYRLFQWIAEFHQVKLSSILGKTNKNTNSKTQKQEQNKESVI